MTFMSLFIPVDTIVPYRGQDSDYDHLMNVPIRRFHSVDDLTFDMMEPTRYLLEDPRFSLPLDLLFIPRKGSRRLLVAFHGAESRAAADLPKFQFVRSFTTRKDSMLFVSDSTLLQGNKITLGWLAGNKDTPLAQLVADSVNRARQQADITETVLAGHSAGGFAAILVGCQVPNSRAVSVNGQTVVDRFWPWTVKNLNKFAFPECESPVVMMTQYADRLDLREALQNRLETSSFTYFGNRRDPATFDNMPHFELLAEDLGLDAEGGRTSRGDAFVVADWGKEGSSPHALPGSMIPFLTLTLEERQSSVPIKYTVDPRWHI